MHVCRHTETANRFRNVICALIILFATTNTLRNGSAMAQTTGTTAGSEKVVATGESVSGLEPLDQLMTSFVKEHDVPGAALAVTRNGRLVYARGFGFADRDKKTPVQPTSLFRIASISKPVTAVAILQLVERGKLKLDDKVFDVLSVKLRKTGESTADPRLKQVTIRQLLQHTGGWDRSKSFDPMFRSVTIAETFQKQPPAMPADIIRYMATQPLDFDPGTRYAYSNFGYCLLGRVVERISRLSYEQYVRKNVLKPAGIREMRLGKTLPSGRAPNEVTYYDRKGRSAPTVFGFARDTQVPLPYGAWCVEAMDAHGGWIASAVDLARFAAAFDDPKQSKLLKADSIRTMFLRPKAVAGFETDGTPKDAYYGCGWLVRPIGKTGKSNNWHTGSLAGTSTILVRRHDGMNWVVLFNGRQTKNGNNLAPQIDSLVHKAVDKVRDWPQRDLFKTVR